MGISRDSRHKRRNTGGKRVIHVKKRKFELGRPAANTRIGAKRVHTVRTRVCTRKARILNVVYNASNNELVRTKTLVKNCIVQVDSAPYRSWYKTHYGIELNKKAGLKKKDSFSISFCYIMIFYGEDEADKKKSNKVLRRQAKNCKTREIDENLADQFNNGRLLACISSRPGQSGRADGYILEGPELAFYLRKIKK
eukprot:GSMAST32.ASY1.ANO1.1689.1 assembled CDS